MLVIVLAYSGVERYLRLGCESGGKGVGGGGVSNECVCTSMQQLGVLGPASKKTKSEYIPIPPVASFPGLHANLRTKMGAAWEQGYFKIVSEANF